MKKKWLKKGLAIALSTAMVLGVMPQTGLSVTEVQAATTNESPSTSQFATKAQLMTEFDLDNSTDATVQKVIFGQNGSGKDQVWKIAGTDSGISGDNIILLADTSLGNANLTNKNDCLEGYKKNYPPDSDCTYTIDMTGKQVGANHYGCSNMRTLLSTFTSDGNTNYFSLAEKRKMNITTIYTSDLLNNTAYSTNDILYVPYIANDNTYVTVGTNDAEDLTSGVQVNNSECIGGVFWLRTPHNSSNGNSNGYVVNERNLDYFTSIWGYNLEATFDLNLSSVIFASAATTATDEGSTVSDAFTLRYEATDNIGTAQLNESKTKVGVTNAVGNYLVVQNSTGAWSKKITNDSEVISASSLDSSLSDFENCKVWIEKTDDRISYASEATQGSGKDVAISYDDTMTTTGNSDQICLAGAMTDVTFTVADGYYFPDDYSVDSVDGISVTKNDENTITVSGTPSAASVDITLPAATVKPYDITYDANGGSGTMDQGTATEDVAFTLPACGFTAPTGKQFKNWAIGSTTGETVEANGTHTFTGATTVYAIWENIPATETAVRGHSLTLNGDIGVNFYTTLSDEVKNSSTAYVLLNCDGTETKVMVSDAVAKGTQSVTVDSTDYACYKFTCNVVAKQMAKPVAAKLYTDESDTNPVDLGSYAVKDYLVVAQNQDDENLKDMVNKMLDYGTYAQIYFEYDTENLAVATPSDLSGLTLTSYGYTWSVWDAEKIKYAGSSLVLESETTLREYFEIVDDSIDVTKLSSDSGRIRKKTDSLYYVEIPNITASNLGVRLTANIYYDGTQQLTIYQSALNYAKRMSNKDTSSNELKNLLKALNQYGEAAEKYFTNKSN